MAFVSLFPNMEMMILGFEIEGLAAPNVRSTNVNSEGELDCICLLSSLQTSSTATSQQLADKLATNTMSNSKTDFW